MIAISLVLAALSVLAYGSAPALLPALAIAAVAPPLVRTDVAEHRLPNHLVIPALLAGVAGAGVSWLAVGSPPIVALLSGTAYGGGLLLLALFGGVGMGDVKLAAALGLASPTAAVAVLSPLLTFLFGGVAAVVVLIRRGRRARLAFGPFLLAGFFAAVALEALEALASVTL